MALYGLSGRYPRKVRVNKQLENVASVSSKSILPGTWMSLINDLMWQRVSHTGRTEFYRWKKKMKRFSFKKEKHYLWSSQRMSYVYIKALLHLTLVDNLVSTKTEWAGGKYPVCLCLWKFLQIKRGTGNIKGNHCMRSSSFHVRNKHMYKACPTRSNRVRFILLYYHNYQSTFNKISMYYVPIPLYSDWKNGCFQSSPTFFELRNITEKQPRST